MPLLSPSLLSLRIVRDGRGFGGIARSRTFGSEGTSGWRGEAFPGGCRCCVQLTPSHQRNTSGFLESGSRYQPAASTIQLENHSPLFDIPALIAVPMPPVESADVSIRTRQPNGSM